MLWENAARVHEILRTHDVDNVKEFVECLMLLMKCAQQWLIVACELLLNDCGTGVEGVSPL